MICNRYFVSYIAKAVGQDGKEIATVGNRVVLRPGKVESNDDIRILQEHIADTNGLIPGSVIVMNYQLMQEGIEHEG